MYSLVMNTPVTCNPEKVNVHPFGHIFAMFIGSCKICVRQIARILVQIRVGDGKFCNRWINDLKTVGHEPV